MNDAATIESVPVEQLLLDPQNARQHGPRNLQRIKDSLQRFGQQRPILVDAQNIVRAGNGTLMAARSLGWPTIMVLRTTLTGAEAKAYAIADNRTAELAEWDLTQLELAAKELDLSNIIPEDELQLMLHPWQGDPDAVDRVEASDEPAMAKVVCKCSAADEDTVRSVVAKALEAAGLGYAAPE